MPDPFTIRVYVPNGDPEGVRIIDRMNWTGTGIVFPREEWLETRSRSEFGLAGVYILVGFEEDEELPTIYVGQADGVLARLNSHFKKKDFWDWGITFVSTGGGLNRAHITWLEYALVDMALKAKRCKLDNGNAPTEPALSEQERADTKAFLKEMLQILPLVGLRVFEVPKAVAQPRTTTTEAASVHTQSDEIDTIVVPAQDDGFQRVFLGEHCWHAIRIGGGKLSKIKYIAAYQSRPVSAITHVAPVDRIEPYGDGGKYKVVFTEPAQAIGPIPFDDAPGGYMQGTRYTTLAKLRAAKKVTDIA